MALIECTECGKDISDKASACPNCGAPQQPVNDQPLASAPPVSVEIETKLPPQPPPPPKNKKKTGLWVLLFVILIIAWIGYVGNKASEKEKEQAAAEAAKTPEQRATEAKAKEEMAKAAAQAREAEQKKEDIENARFARVRAVTRVVRESARNPKSLEWIDVYANENGDNVCVKFRAQNGFGGMTISQYGFSKDKGYDASENVAGYNKICAGKGFFDMKYAAQ